MKRIMTARRNFKFDLVKGGNFLIEEESQWQVERCVDYYVIQRNGISLEIYPEEYNHIFGGQQNLRVLN